jgi:hypothetical protein
MLLLYAECDLMPSWENSGQAAHEYIKCFITASVVGTPDINTKYLT